MDTADNLPIQEHTDANLFNQMFTDEQVELGSFGSAAIPTDGAYSVLRNDDSSSTGSGISLDRGQSTPEYGQYSRLTNNTEDVIGRMEFVHADFRACLYGGGYPPVNFFS